MSQLLYRFTAKPQSAERSQIADEDNRHNHRHQAWTFSHEKKRHSQRQTFAHQVVNTDADPRGPGLGSSSRQPNAKFTQQSSGQRRRQKRQAAAHQAHAHDHADDRKQKQRAGLGYFGEQHNDQRRVDKIFSNQRHRVHAAAGKSNQQARELGSRGKNTDEHQLSRFPMPLSDGSVRHNIL